MIVITGGAGFIGSALLWKLNSLGLDEVVIVDDLGVGDKWKNLAKRSFADYLHKDLFLELIRRDDLPFRVETIFHLGACSSTTERDANYLMENNYRYSCHLANWARGRGVRFIYASSAATYGDGSLGFSDQDETTKKLRPINMYGYSKHLFDLFILRNHWEKWCVGVKFFNVFGPNEYHKGDMVSMVFKAFQQIRQTGQVRLFKSYLPQYEDGGQLRDFVYVKDCVEALVWFMEHGQVNGIFNLGTGKARNWNDLMRAVFSAVNREPKIEYIDMPPSLRNQYQYFTEARMEKLLASNYHRPFTSLERAVEDYVINHLDRDDPYL